jgi:hypothetical protein
MIRRGGLPPPLIGGARRAVLAPHPTRPRFCPIPPGWIFCGSQPN